MESSKEQITKSIISKNPKNAILTELDPILKQPINSIMKEYNKIKNELEPKSNKQIKYVNYTNSILLNSNSINNIENIYNVMNEIVHNVDEPAKLKLNQIKYFHKLDLIQWIDLSNNNIQIINKDLLNFKYLKILYLHNNCISNIQQIKSLTKFKLLAKLTLKGNPIEAFSGYRYIIIEMLPLLLNLDFALITEKELDIIKYKATRNCLMKANSNQITSNLKGNKDYSKFKKPFITK